MEWETLKIEGEGPILQLVLNRPEKLNAISNQMLKDIVDASFYLDSLPDCRSVILRGEGRSFSAGADLSEGITHGGSSGQMMARSKMGARAVDALTEVNAITIAALHGHVIGGAACLAMACDFRIGATSTQVSIRESSLGISLSWHSIPNVVHLVGPTRAKEMIYFGEFYSAEKMLEYGFLEEVVDAKMLLETAEKLAAKVVAQPPLPLTLSKSTINAVVKAMDRAICNLDEVGVTFTGKSHDSEIARKSLVTGEKPFWKNE